jgi:hypothetical protein
MSHNAATLTLSISLATSVKVVPHRWLYTDEPDV